MKLWHSNEESFTVTYCVEALDGRSCLFELVRLGREDSVRKWRIILVISVILQPHSLHTPHLSRQSFNTPASFKGHRPSWSTSLKQQSPFVPWLFCTKPLPFLQRLLAYNSPRETISCRCKLMLRRSPKPRLRRLGLRIEVLPIGTHRCTAGRSVLTLDRHMSRCGCNNRRLARARRP